MELPNSDTPLYNHTLPNIEDWLKDNGCQQDKNNLNCWSIDRSSWSAEICLEKEELRVSYLKAGEKGDNLHRSFKYSLSRQDIESAVFSGP